jgi:hypothetical protein
MKYITILIAISFCCLLQTGVSAAGGGGVIIDNNNSDTTKQPVNSNIPTYTGSFGFEQSTSFYGNSGSSCGVQAYTDVGQGSNPQAETSWRVGMVLNSQKCIDQTTLETIRSETNKYQSDTQQNIACISARSDLIKNGHNPDEVCILK